jgi:hypothetical protein
MPASIVGTAMMAAHAASRFVTSLSDSEIMPRLTCIAVVSMSRMPSIVRWIRCRWS